MARRKRYFPSTNNNMFIELYCRPKHKGSICILFDFEKNSFKALTWITWNEKNDATTFT